MPRSLPPRGIDEDQAGIVGEPRPELRNEIPELPCVGGRLDVTLQRLEKASQLRERRRIILHERRVDIDRDALLAPRLRGRLERLEPL